jgi:hypothetical protein
VHGDEVIEDYEIPFPYVSEIDYEIPLNGESARGDAGFQTLVSLSDALSTITQATLDFEHTGAMLPQDDNPTERLAFADCLLGIDRTNWGPFTVDYDPVRREIHVTAAHAAGTEYERLFRWRITPLA